MNRRTLTLVGLTWSTLMACGGSDSARHIADARAGDGSGTPALSLSALPAGAFAYTQGSYIESFEFMTSGPVRVTQLGYYDSNLTGTTQTFAPTQVGLYDMTTSMLLGSATVQADDPATGIFRFHALATPIALDGSDTYAAVAVTSSDHYVSGYNYHGELASALVWLSFAGYGDSNLTQTTTLVQPDYFWTTTGNLGPDFIFEQN